MAFVEFGGPLPCGPSGWGTCGGLAYNDVSAARNTVAVVHAPEAILGQHAQGQPGCVVTVNDQRGGLILWQPGRAEPDVLYPGRV